MKETTNYEMFKKHPNNRDISYANLDKIRNSIKTKNLLEYRPIIVNRDMEVIDGQHRLQVAKELNLPIFYQIQEEEASEDIFLLNANQKSWTNEDFLNYYESKENQNYMKLGKFKRKHGLTIKECIAVLSIPKSGNDSKKFMEGKFKYPSQEQEVAGTKSLEQINTFITFVATKTPISTRSMSSACLKRSLVYFFNLNCFDFDTFMRKLEIKLEMFRQCSRVKDYMELFARIYNYNNRNPISLDEGIG